MTPQQIEAMKLALEALYPIAHNTTDDPRGQAYKAITALEEVLAQPEQEPVAWMDEEMTCIFFDAERPEPFDFDFWKPLYTTPPQRTWVGLTEQDLDYLCNLAYTGDEEFALAVQAKLMEKNA